MRIYKEYVADGSTTQANLSHDERRNIENSLAAAISNFSEVSENWRRTPIIYTSQPLDYTLFDDAKMSTLRLIGLDPFNRWQSSVRTEIKLRQKLAKGQTVDGDANKGNGCDATANAIAV